MGLRSQLEVLQPFPVPQLEGSLRPVLVFLLPLVQSDIPDRDRLLVGYGVLGGPVDVARVLHLVLVDIVAPVLLYRPNTAGQ